MVNYMSGLNKLTKLIESMPAFQRLLEELTENQIGTAVVLDAARPYLITALYENIQAPMLIITAQPENARKLHEQFSSWCRSNQIYLFPEQDALPYERLASDIGTEIERIKALTSLTGCDEDEKETEYPLVIASAAAIMSRTADRHDFVGSCRTIKLGMNIEPLRLMADWAEIGYRLENTVEIPGTISHRGGIIDIFPSTSECPFRLEFFGDNIDSIRAFDAATQRSIDKADSFTVVPATEILAPRHMSKQSLEDILDGIDLAGCNGETRQQLQRDRELFLAVQSPPEAQFY